MTEPINIILAAGSYISIVKLAIFAVLFLVWIPLINWVHHDTQTVRTNVFMWTMVVTGIGAASIVIWFFSPMFLIGLAVYIVALGGATLAYVIHRDARVADFEKIISVAQVKSLFVNETKKIEKASRGFEMSTANGNEVPLPEPKTPEAIGFAVTCEILEDALWKRASEIIFAPKQEEYTVTYKIDGLPIPQDPHPREDIEYLIYFLKQVADLDIKEKRKPQTGPFRTEKDDQRTNWELNTAGSTAGEHCKIIKAEEYSVMKLKDLGMTEKQVETLSGIRNIKSGVFIISGPKKSGVTSTFYAMLRSHDPFMNNINTIEKKPATELQNITQNTYKPGQIDENTGEEVTYGRRMQSILRTGPDILGVADAEDKQTAYLACKAAKDNKVVHVTLEATSVMQALSKWLKLVDDRELAGGTLLGISNQRLVRKLCEECKQAYQPNPDLLRKFNLPANKIKVLYRPGEVEYTRGGKPIICEHCQGTGYYGRTGIFETVLLTEELREVVKKASSIQEIANQFRRAGMLYMQEQSIRRVAKGVTSINEVVREFTPANNKKQQKKKEG